MSGTKNFYFYIMPQKDNSDILIIYGLSKSTSLEIMEPVS